MHKIWRQRQNGLYTHGGIVFTHNPHLSPADAVHRTTPPVPQALADHPPETAIDPPRSPHTGRQPPRSSSVPAAIATPGHHRGRTPDPRPNTDWTPGARTHVRTGGGTDGSPGTFAAQPGYHVHLKTDSKREVWQRDGGRCSYVDPRSGRRCASRHLLQIDHQVPHALGGSAAPANLLSCASPITFFRHQRQSSPAEAAEQGPLSSALVDEKRVRPGPHAAPSWRTSTKRPVAADSLAASEV